MAKMTIETYDIPKVDELRNRQTKINDSWKALLPDDRDIIKYGLALMPSNEIIRLRKLLRFGDRLDGI